MFREELDKGRLILGRSTAVLSDVQFKNHSRSHKLMFTDAGVLVLSSLRVSMHGSITRAVHCVNLTMYKYLAVWVLCLLVPWQFPTIVSPLFSCICCTGLKTK